VSKAMRLVLPVALLIVALVAAPVGAQVHREDPRNEAEPPQPPPLAERVERAVQAPYLTDEEQAALRVFHGRWREEDLQAPTRRAKAALIAGVWSDPSLTDAAASAEDRAEAQLHRGDLQGVIETLDGATTLRARRIRAAALEGLGRFKQAETAIEPIIEDLSNRRADHAQSVVEGVRALAIRARLRGEPASEYHRMMDLLGHARTQLDQLHWPAALTEARLLYRKDNRPEARKALLEVLSLNPRSAEAWAMFGRLAVDGFNIDAARGVADRLDRIAQEFTGRDDAFSPWADVILARAALRQNDPDLAEQALFETLERHPKMREALALRCAIAAVRYDFEKTDRLLARFDELSPGSPVALHAVGAALSEARQYERSAKYLQRAIERQPNWPPPRIELGLMRLQSGRDVAARDALREATRLDPFNVRARNSLSLIEELLTYETVESPHFVVRYKPGVDEIMAREMLEPLERIHEIVSGALDHEPKRKTIIELMPNHRWFAVRITGMPAIHTIAAATGPVVAMEAPKIGANHSGAYDWTRVVQHEYAHTITLSRTNNRIPHWFTEAAAVHLEKAPRDFSTVQLLTSALKNDALFDLEQINIAFVRPEKPTDRAQAYAQGHWMYEYIIETWGQRAPLKLMDLYARGLREAEAFQSALGVSRESFLEGFKPWARDQARAWGMLPEPSVEQLLLDETLEDQAGRERLAEALGERAMAVGSALAGAGGIGEFQPPLLEPTEAMVDGWLDAHPAHPDALQLKIEFALQDDDEPGLALAPTLTRYAHARPVDPTPHRLLARMYLEAEDSSVRNQAIEHLEYLDAREQKSPVYAVELARRYAVTGDWDRAQEKAARATRIAPFDPAATIALQRGDLPAAQRHVEALTRIEPDRPIHQRRLERIKQLRAERG